MTSPLGPTAFFALEAGECLDRLDALLQVPEGPSGPELVRRARVLRGSALMANHPLLARAAAAFEALGRAVRDGVRPWDAATREQASQAVEEYRLLVRRLPERQEGDAARAAQLAARLESLAGQGPLEAERLHRATTTAGDLQTGVRAFVAREGALIASALDRAARAFRAAPDDREPLYMVLRRMQSLQGLAELPELPPLPDILEGVELAVGDLARLHAPPPGVDAVLAAAAVALSRVARDIAEHGLPASDAEESRRFTELLLEAFAVERDVVPIESLLVPADGSGERPAMQRAPAGPQFSPPSPPGALELVSLGEHLVQTAGRLEAARSDTELDLRLYRLIGTLRGAASPLGEPVSDALGMLARAAREAVAAGVARDERARFASALRETGELLRSAGAAPDRAELSRRILSAARELDPSHVPTDAPVPIATLAYEAERERANAAPDAAPDAGSAPAPAPAPPIVPVDALCYRGRGALERADEIGRELRRRLAEQSDLSSVHPLLDELLDLVPLALAEPV